AKVEFTTHQSPKHSQDQQRYAVGEGILATGDSGQPARGLSRGTIVRKITDGGNFRNQTQAHLSAVPQLRQDDSVPAELLKGLKDTKLERNLAAMTRGEVELVRHGRFSITGRADVLGLDFAANEHEGANANVLNEVNQVHVQQPATTRDLGFRILGG